MAGLFLHSTKKEQEREDAPESTEAPSHLRRCVRLDSGQQEGAGSVWSGRGNGARREVDVLRASVPSMASKRNSSAKAGRKFRTFRRR